MVGGPIREATGLGVFSLINRTKPPIILAKGVNLGNRAIFYWGFCDVKKRRWPKKVDFSLWEHEQKVADELKAKVAFLRKTRQ